MKPFNIEFLYKIQLACVRFCINPPLVSKADYYSGIGGVFFSYPIPVNTLFRTEDMCSIEAPWDFVASILNRLMRELGAHVAIDCSSNGLIECSIYMRGRNSVVNKADTVDEAIIGAFVAFANSRPHWGQPEGPSGNPYIGYEGKFVKVKYRDFKHEVEHEGELRCLKFSHTIMVGSMAIGIANVISIDVIDRPTQEAKEAEVGE